MRRSSRPWTVSPYALGPAPSSTTPKAVHERAKAMGVAAPVRPSRTVGAKMRPSTVIVPLLLVVTVGTIVGAAVGSANPKTYNLPGAIIVSVLLAVGTLP